jgi:transketolase
MPIGMADVATVLFEKHLKFDPRAPRSPDRDRFILLVGYGSMLLYSLLYLTGYADMTIEQIRNFRQCGAITAGHPEYGHVEGVETTTGPLGQGIANAVGFAIAEEHLWGRLGAELCDHFTYVIAGDGCLMESVSQEAIGLAGKLQLSRLIMLWDNNGIGWDRWLLGERGRYTRAGFVGMSSFGASAQTERLYAEFGITVGATTAMVKRLLGRSES